MEKLVLDRFEENRAVIEKTHYNGEVSYFSVPRSMVASEAREGDILRAENESYLPATEETESEKKKALSLLERIKGKKA